MRRTVMTSGDGGRITIETDDAGTTVLDAAGMVVAQHGTDRHAEMVAIRQEAGWRVTEDGQIRPPEAEGDPPPAGSAAGNGQQEPDLGISS